MVDLAVTLQRMTRDDFDTYLALEQRVKSRTYATAQNREEAAEEFAQGPMYFIKQADRIVGTVSYAKKEDGSVYLNGLAIDPDFQGYGVGTVAIKMVLDEIGDVPRVWLVTHPDNRPAISLYTGLGFRETDRIENYHGDGEPRIVFSRDKVY